MVVDVFMFAIQRDRIDGRPDVVTQFLLEALFAVAQELQGGLLGQLLQLATLEVGHVVPGEDPIQRNSLPLVPQHGWLKRGAVLDRLGRFLSNGQPVWVCLMRLLEFCIIIIQRVHGLGFEFSNIQALPVLAVPEDRLQEGAVFLTYYFAGGR